VPCSLIKELVSTNFIWHLLVEEVRPQIFMANLDRRCCQTTFTLAAAAAAAHLSVKEEWVELGTRSITFADHPAFHDETKK
jgi:hypothetical protein